MILDNKIKLPRKIGTANTTGAAATLVQATNYGKKIYLVDLINGDGSNMASLKHNATGGALIAQVGAGAAISLNAPIEVNFNEATVNNASGYAVANSITIAVDPTPRAMVSGELLYFENGAIFTLTAAKGAGSTTLAGNLTVAALTDNAVGKTKAKVHVDTATKFTATYLEEV